MDMDGAKAGGGDQCTWHGTQAICNDTDGACAGDATCPDSGHGAGYINIATNGKDAHAGDQGAATGVDQRERRGAWAERKYRVDAGAGVDTYSDANGEGKKVSSTTTSIGRPRTRERRASLTTSSTIPGMESTQRT